MNDLTVIQASQGLCRNAETLASHSPTFNVDVAYFAAISSRRVSRKRVSSLVMMADTTRKILQYAFAVLSEFSPESRDAHLACRRSGLQPCSSTAACACTCSER